jgi:PH (Pleckstrin Homology) domain-containing protein/putative oligomerization/nucleic acid binding protein
MGYAEGLMSTGERIVAREKQHWFVFIWGARYTILAIVLAGIGAIVQTNLSSPWREILGWAAAILFIGGLLLLGWTILRYLNQEYVLTNRRVIMVEGVLNKKSTDSSLEKINDAVLTQSIFGRIFGFGDLEVLTASEAGISLFRMLVNPVAFKRAMLDAKHEYEQDLARGDYPASPPIRREPMTPVPAPGAGPPPAAAGAPSEDTVSTAIPSPPPGGSLTVDEVTRTLESLADLRDRGAITPDEFERRKNELLNRL